MFRTADLFLLVVVFLSMLAGIFLPDVGIYFQPYPLYFMMSLLFLSFLSLELSQVGKTLLKHISMTLWLIFFKLFMLPGAVFLILKWVYPKFAIAGLLLSGVSTGVVAPFIATFVRSNGALVLVMVVTTSLLVPLTLPLLAELCLGKSLELSLFAMVKMLSMIVFIPVLAVEFLRRWLPNVSKLLLKRRYPISLFIFAAINLGVFSKYSEYFRQEPEVLLSSILVALGLGGIFFILGLASAWRAKPTDKIASAISCANINNVLIIVFASKFFGPLEATVAAIYMIPFFLIIFPLRICEHVFNASLLAESRTF